MLLLRDVMRGNLLDSTSLYAILIEKIQRGQLRVVTPYIWFYPGNVLWRVYPPTASCGMGNLLPFPFYE